MALVSVRHSEAEGKKEGSSDAARALTENGRDLARKAGLKLKEIGFVPKNLICSPALRAIETAQIILEVLGIDLPMRQVEGLFDWTEMGPAMDKLGVIQNLDAYQDGEFHGALAAFEDNRAVAFKDALTECAVDPLDDVLVVSHGWVAQAVVMAIAPEQKHVIRAMGLAVASSLVLEQDGKLSVLEP